MKEPTSDKLDSSTSDLSVSPFLSKEFEIFSSQIRLSVMLVLYNHSKVKITDLQQAFNITSGKLEHHLTMLEKEGFIHKKAGIFPRRVQFVLESTDKGREKLRSYIEVMKDIVTQIDL